MKKILVFSLFIFMLPQIVHSQNKRDYKWIFGRQYIVSQGIVKGNILDFNNKGKIDTLDFYDSVADNNAPICDEDGNLLFYFNGCRIVDSTFQLMENGDSINFGKTWEDYCGNWSRYPGTQNSIVLPDPGNENGYYLIHKREELIYEPYIQVSIPELYYSYIDMTGNIGRGKVSKKNETLFKTTDLVVSYLSACKHANGKDWWLIQMEQDTDIYFKILLSESGFEVDSQSIGPLIFSPNSGVGQAVFSPDGTKWLINSSYDGCLIYDFDRDNGDLSNPQHIMPQDSGMFYGVAVSPNSRFAYLSNDWDLFQIDLWEEDIASSLVHIAHIDSFPDNIFWSHFGQAQLAPDCKIYIVSSTGNNYLHVINKPDEKGIACDFRQHSVYLPHRNWFNCIPNFPHFRIDEEEICDPTITSVFGKEVLYRKDLLVFPNPSSGIFNIQIPESNKGNLIVIDQNGLIIEEKKVNVNTLNIQVDISHSPDGSYFIEFFPDKIVDQVFYGGQVVKLSK